MKLLFGKDVAVAAWVAQHLGLETGFHPPYTAIGVLDSNGFIIGGAVFNDYNSHNIEVTVYGPGAMKRGVLMAGFHYAFEQMGCRRLSVSTRRSNKVMRKILVKLGFKYEGTRPGYFGPLKGDAAIIFGMEKDSRAWRRHSSPRACAKSKTAGTEGSRPSHDAAAWQS